VSATIKWDQGAIANLLYSQNGDVGKSLAIRAQRVQDGARSKIHNRTGRLAASITKRWTTVGPNLAIQVGSWTCPYALFVEMGAGPHNIPNAFGWGPNFGTHGRFNGKFHPGNKAQHFLSDSLPLAL